MGALKEYFCGYAAHAKWANRLMLESMSEVSDADYYRELIPGVRSMHDLMNHMIIMDELWVSELRQSGPRDEISSGDYILYADRATILAARAALDDQIEACIAQIDEETLVGQIQYDEFGMEWPVWVEFAHVFRHQIHHRGQMSALVAALGLEPPKLDPMFFPPRAASRGGAEYLAARAAAKAAQGVAPVPILAGAAHAQDL